MAEAQERLALVAAAETRQTMASSEKRRAGANGVNLLAGLAYLFT